MAHSDHTLTNLNEQLRVFRLKYEILEKNCADKDKEIADLKISEMKYRDYYNNSPDMYVSVDAQSASIRDCNQTLIDRTGYLKDEIIGKPIFEMYHPDCLDEVKQAFQQFVSTGEIRDKELQLRLKDGSKLDVSLNVSSVLDENGNVLFSRSCWRDLSNQKLVEIKRTESEEKFRILSEQSPNMVFINQKGRIVYVNPNCVIEMGFSKEEFYSPDFNFLHLISPEDQDITIRSFERHMAGEEVDPIEYRLITKYGQSIDAIISFKLIEYKGERAILGTVTDISERKRNENALRESEEEYRSLFNSIRDSILVTDTDRNILDCNPAFTSLFKYDLEELRGKKTICI